MNLTKVLTLSVLVTVAAVSCNRQDVAPLYKDASAPVEKRVEDLLSRMTLEEKVR